MVKQPKVTTLANVSFGSFIFSDAWFCVDLQKKKKELVRHDFRVNANKNQNRIMLFKGTSRILSLDVFNECIQYRPGIIQVPGLKDEHNRWSLLLKS